jgi:hypothetical protein
VTSVASPGLTSIYGMVEQQYREATRSISPVGYTTDERGAVVPFVAAPGSPLDAVAHRAEVILAAGEYAGQKAALDARHARDGIDIFVASVLVIERDSSLTSLAVWVQDVDSLLPRADLVAFQPADDDDATRLTVPFDRVASEAVLVAEPDHDPPRYRVTAWPDEAVMARLRTWAVPL